MILPGWFCAGWGVVRNKYKDSRGTQVKISCCNTKGRTAELKVVRVATIMLPAKVWAAGTISKAPTAAHQPRKSGGAPKPARIAASRPKPEGIVSGQAQ